MNFCIMVFVKIKMNLVRLITGLSLCALKLQLARIILENVALRGIRLMIA